MTTIYTLGYSGWKMDDLVATVERLDTILVDVRMVPRSRVATWNGKSFQQRLGDRYVWLKEFGNRNYKGTFDQIEIADFEAGLAKLRQLSPDRAVVLLCGCPDVNTCHRKVLAEWVADLWGMEVTHLTQPRHPKTGQWRLF